MNWCCLCIVFFFSSLSNSLVLPHLQHFWIYAIDWRCKTIHTKSPFQSSWQAAPFFSLSSSVSPPSSPPLLHSTNHHPSFLRAFYIFDTRHLLFALLSCKLCSLQSCMTDRGRRALEEGERDWKKTRGFGGEGRTDFAWKRCLGENNTKVIKQLIFHKKIQLANKLK